MEFMFKFLVILLLILCIESSIHVVAYYAASYQEQMEAHDIISEGPDCRTMKWYVMDAVVKFDDVVCEFSKTFGDDRLLVMWRTWLQEQYGVTMY